MEFTQLVTASAREIGGAAFRGFGWQIGRDAYRNIGNIIGFVFATLIGIGGFILPFLAARKITQWHPISPARYFFHVLVTWSFAGAFGIALLFGVLTLLASVKLGGHRTDAEYLEAGMILTSIVGIGLVLAGALAGYFDRAKRKEAYQILRDNQNFLNSHGIRDLDGGSVTHVDGMGNHLRLEHTGRDLIEFKAIGACNKRAFITVGKDGRFLNYSGLVEA